MTVNESTESLERSREEERRGGWCTRCCVGCVVWCCGCVVGAGCCVVLLKSFVKAIFLIPNSDPPTLPNPQVWFSCSSPFSPLSSFLLSCSSFLLLRFSFVELQQRVQRFLEGPLKAQYKYLFELQVCLQKDPKLRPTASQLLTTVLTFFVSPDFHFWSLLEC